MTHQPLESSPKELGEALVARLFAGLNQPAAHLPDDLKRYTFEHLFGDVWQGSELELSERSIITCAVLVALGKDHEQRYHFRGARNLGISKPKIEAMITHIAHYAGWPAAFGAIRTLNEVWTEMDNEAGSVR
jgi:4-carboxymuconolactone decarboxylase